MAFNVFNRPAAVQAGTQNALAQFKTQMAPQQMQSDMQNEMVARKLNGLKYIAATAPIVTPETYPGWHANLVSSGMAQKGDLPDTYDPNIMARLAGGAQSQLKIGKYNPRDYTTDSWVQFINSGDPGQLVRYAPSAEERIAQDPNLASRVAETQGQISQSKATGSETGKSNVQMMMKPKIEAAVAEAKKKAAAAGTAFTELQKAKATLPGLMEVADKLGTLADIATYTYGGRAFDEVVKQLGFGSTKGATARAKMISIVNNQVLPLLRQTFGAAFTVPEGESLKATLMDANATPEQKKATLKAFIEQKVRDIENKQREVGLYNQNQPFNAMPGAQSGGVDSALSNEDQQALEWARQNPNDPRAQQILQLNGVK